MVQRTREKKLLHSQKQERDRETEAKVQHRTWGRNLFARTYTNRTKAFLGVKMLARDSELLF